MLSVANPNCWPVTRTFGFHSWTLGPGRGKLRPNDAATRRRGGKVTTVWLCRQVEEGEQRVKHVEGTLCLAWLHRVGCLGVYGTETSLVVVVVGQKRGRLRMYVRLASFRNVEYQRAGPPTEVASPEAEHGRCQGEAPVRTEG